MTYRRFRLPESDRMPATVATVATEPLAGAQSVASVATVAAAEDRNAAFEERAAIVEYDGGVPREWAEGFARLDLAEPPAGFDQNRWRQLIDDGGRFLDRWAETAAECGWSATDIFGLHPGVPAARYDGMGLVALIGGGEVIAVRNDSATIVDELAPAVAVKADRRLGEIEARKALGPLSWHAAVVFHDRGTLLERRVPILSGCDSCDSFDGTARRCPECRKCRNCRSR